MLEINGLTVAYGERLALRNFSLSMQEGEIVALVGESGSGKTTAIRSVLGLLPPGGAVTEYPPASAPPDTRRKMISFSSSIPAPRAADMEMISASGYSARS